MGLVRRAQRWRLVFIFRRFAGVGILFLFSFFVFSFGLGCAAAPACSLYRVVVILISLF